MVNKEETVVEATVLQLTNAVNNSINTSIHNATNQAMAQLPQMTAIRMVAVQTKVATDNRHHSLQQPGDIDNQVTARSHLLWTPVQEMKHCQVS